MKTLIVIFTLAAVIASVITLASSPEPVEQKLIRIHASEVLDDFPGLKQQPIDVQAVLIDMAHDPVLVLKARAALLAYPAMARQLLPMYGSEPEFQDILRRYGEVVLPLVQYFVSNPVDSVKWISKAGRQYQIIKQWITRNESTLTPADAAQPLTALERGWYAVQFINSEGHDFLGQFVLSPEGNVEWLASERVLEGVNQFFVGGIRQLETRYRMGEEIGADDIGWATVDVLVFASAVKVLRLGRAAAVTTRGASRGVRSGALAARISRGGRMVLGSARYARWPLIVGAGYLVVAHPSLINDLLADLAQVLGAPALLIQFLGWLLLLAPALYLLRSLLWFATPLLQTALWSGAWLLTRFRGMRAT